MSLLGYDISNKIRHCTPLSGVQWEFVRQWRPPAGRAGISLRLKKRRGLGESGGEGDGLISVSHCANVFVYGRWQRDNR
jgi:hypothetical protein